MSSGRKRLSHPATTAFILLLVLVITSVSASIDVPDANTNRPDPFSFQMDKYGCLNAVGTQVVAYSDADCWQIDVHMLGNGGGDKTLSPSKCTPSASSPHIFSTSRMSTSLICSDGGFNVTLSAEAVVMSLPYNRVSGDGFVTTNISVVQTSASSFVVTRVQPFRGMQYKNPTTSTRVSTNPWASVDTLHSAIFTRFQYGSEVGTVVSARNPFTAYHADGCMPGYDRPNGDFAGMPVTGTSRSQCEKLCSANSSSCVAYVWAQDSKDCFLKSTLNALTLDSTKCVWSRDDNAPQGDGVMTATYYPSMNSTTFGVWLGEGVVAATTSVTGYPTSSDVSVLDYGELRAYRDVVAYFLMERRTATTKVHVAWDESDYEMDISTSEGRAQYTRVLSRAGELGITHVVFGPGNSLRSSIANNTDGWNMENVLWLTLGQSIREGKYDPSTDAMPNEIQTMLDTAHNNGVKLLAYVYPILGFLAEQDSKWLYPCTTNTNHVCASLASPEFQDYMISTLSALVNRTGMGGFAWDYTFLSDPRQTTRYAEWRGWMNIIQTLRMRFPDIVMDHRQQNHMYGAWYQLAGTYAEPIAGDENPETYGVQFPSLHTDHVTAPHVRQINQVYMMKQMLPIERVPGFMFHQSERNAANGAIVRGNDTFNIRDFDLLGCELSVLSSIGTAPWNNVFTMLPARDESEYKLLPRKTIAFINNWMAFVDYYMPVLRNLVFITPGVADPPKSQIDATAAFGTDPTSGIMLGIVFLFNAGNDAQSLDINIDASIGMYDITGNNTMSRTWWVVTERYPIDNTNIDVVQFGTTLSISVPARGARVLMVKYFDIESSTPVAIGASADITFNADKNAVDLMNFAAPAGTTTTLRVVNLAKTPKAVNVSGKALDPTLLHPCPDWPSDSRLGVCVAVKLKMCGDAVTAFSAVTSDSSFPSTPMKAGDTLNTTFVVTSAMLDQVTSRSKSYPIPWDPKVDGDASWLMPNRLLMYFDFDVSGMDYAVPPHVSINGKDLSSSELATARNGRSGALSTNPSQTMTGWYVDVTSKVASGASTTLGVSLPSSMKTRLFGIYWENLETVITNDVCDTI
eukprot:PhM_4_TR2440/c2_g1_i1/m.12607